MSSRRMEVVLPAPLDPFESRIHLLLTVTLLAQLHPVWTQGARDKASRTAPVTAGGRPVRRMSVRRRSVRPPRAC